MHSRATAPERHVGRRPRRRGIITWMTQRSRTLKLHFVRHGETPGNAERRFQTPDVPLSDVGRTQAAALAARLRATTRSQAILASDYLRAMQTAEVLAGDLGLPVTAEPALRERNFGVGRGQVYADIGEETLALWRNPRYRIDGGESWADVYERVAAFFERLKRSPAARELILVTHGGTMSVALSYLEGKPIDEFQILPLENCALRSVVIATDRR